MDIFPPTLPSEFSRLDRAFAQFFAARSALIEPQRTELTQILMRLASEQAQGHNCLLLNAAEQQLLQDSGLALILKANPSPSVIETPLLPLVVEQGRLYCQRYWQYEQRLAQQLYQKMQQYYPVTELTMLLDHYFPDTNSGITDWQRIAAQTALQQALTLITGGPGTGKTTTVVKILALMQTWATRPLHIALAAPTGKAALRLQESIGQQKQQLPCSAEIRAIIPEQVTTLHSLLGVKANSPYFHHHAQQPLPHDLVVVDEASMIDLALMSKLVDALKPAARLILLGDKEQLASVEAGAVLADLSAALIEHAVELKHSHRFGGQIKQLADYVNQGNAQAAWQLVSSNSTDELGLLTEALIPYIAKQQHPYLQLIKAKASYSDIYQAFLRFQVLCATREGEGSVAQINAQVERYLSEENKIQRTGTWYSGRPVLITQNNPTLRLYNGDIGICLKESPSGSLKVFFQRPDGRVQGYAPARITQCETVFAMTVHKSQGSEFEQVLVVLPPTLNPVLTKELLYTAITRAKKTVKLYANSNVFEATVRQKVQRTTGLMHKLNTLIAGIQGS